MKTFTEMPEGYRWFTSEEITDYNDAVAKGGRLWGWMRDEYIGVVVPRADYRLAGYVRMWDCNVEFGMGHDHDPVECERMMFLMNDTSAADAAFDYDSQNDHYERFGRPSFPNEY